MCQKFKISFKTENQAGVAFDNLHRGTRFYMIFSLMDKLTLNFVFATDNFYEY